MHGDWEQGGSRAEDADQAELAAAIAAVRPKLDIMERFVAANGTVVGSFTIADIAFAPVLWRWYRLPLDFSPGRRWRCLRDTVTARPGLRGDGPAGVIPEPVRAARPGRVRPHAAARSSGPTARGSS